LNKKTNITLSIDSNVADQLRDDAAKESKSLNSWINELLTRHHIFYKHYESLEGVGIPGVIFKEMIDVVDEKQMMRWLHKANNEIWPAIMVKDNIPTDIVRFVDYSFGNIARMAGLFATFRHHIDNDSYLCLVFTHKFGLKWSKMIADVFSESLANLFRIEVQHRVTQNTVLLRIPKEDLNKTRII